MKANRVCKHVRCRARVPLSAWKKWRTLHSHSGFRPKNLDFFDNLKVYHA